MLKDWLEAYIQDYRAKITPQISAFIPNRLLALRKHRGGAD
jgi:hypothetical protein